LSILQDRLRFAEYKVRVLEERLRLVRIEKYGPGSEKLSDDQLELLELEPGVSSAEVQAESERAQLKLPLKGAKKHPGRQELPAHLPRIEKIIACTPEQCVCGNCGKENSVIGYEKSEQLDVKPAEYFVVVTKREKRACKDCEEQGVECAPAPVRIIEKGLASDRVVINTVVSKYADYVPLYRQSAILERETGIDLSRATLDGWVKFFDAVKLNPKDTTSIQIVALMDELFAIDAKARQEGLSQSDRHVLRLEKSKPLLEQIEASIQRARIGALPKSALAKACDYALTLWSRLSRFLEYPELELSNNLAENAMRPVALGRRNWIHVGSREAGPRVAAIISIVETCRRLSLPVRDYLGSVLPGLADFPLNRVAELTPSAWAARI
jgi:transposase